MLLPLALTAGLALYNGITSSRRQGRLQSQLDELSKTPYRNFEVDPKIKGLYEQSMNEASNPMGYSGASINSFNQAQGRGTRARYMNALNLGGSSRAVNAVLAGQTGDALNQFYLNDENLRRSNRLSALNRSGTYANSFQRTRDMNTQFANNYKMQTEQALGTGIRQHQDFRQNLFTGMGRDLIGASFYSNFGMGSDGNSSQSNPGMQFNSDVSIPETLPYTNRREFIRIGDILRSAGAYR